jgi:hypothetical protein
MYFIDVANIASKRVLRCGVCGATVITDELARVTTTQTGTVLGGLNSLVQRGVDAVRSSDVDEIIETTKQATEKAAEKAEQGVARAGRFLRSLAKK